MLSRVRTLALALVAAMPAACTSNVPVGFDSGTSVATRDVAAPTEAVWEAARDVLRDRGDVVEIEQDHETGGVMRTGRFRIVVEPQPAGMTHLDVYIARYVGADHQKRADELLEEIVGRVR